MQVLRSVDTIAAFIQRQPPRRARRERVRANALTVDVEEWFHVCGVPALAAAHWDGLPSASSSTTRLLLDVLRRRRRRARPSSWSAGSPSATRSWCTRSARPDTRSDRTAIWHDACYDSGEQAFAPTCAAASPRSRPPVRRTVTASARRSGRSTGARCGRSTCWRRKGSRSTRAWRRCGSSATSAYPRTPHVRQTHRGGPIVEVPPLVADRFGQVMPIGWGWGLRMSAPARVLTEIERANQAGAPAVLTIHPWEIDPDPPRVALPPRLRFAHYFRLDGFLDRLRHDPARRAFGPLDAARRTLSSAGLACPAAWSRSSGPRLPRSPRASRRSRAPVAPATGLLTVVGRPLDRRAASIDVTDPARCARRAADATRAMRPCAAARRLGLSLARPRRPGRDRRAGGQRFARGCARTSRTVAICELSSWRPAAGVSPARRAHGGDGTICAPRPTARRSRSQCRRRAGRIAARSSTRDLAAYVDLIAAPSAAHGRSAGCSRSHRGGRADRCRAVDHRRRPPGGRRWRGDRVRRRRASTRCW